MKSIFKHLCVVAVALTTVFTMSSFTQYDEDEFDVEAILKEAVAEVNAECPRNLGEGMTITGARIAGKRMIYDFMAPSEVVEGLNMMKALDEAATNQLMLESMLSGGDEVIFLFLLCAEADYGIEFRFDSTDGQRASLYLSDDALEGVLEDKYTEAELEEIIGNLILSYM